MGLARVGPAGSRLWAGEGVRDVGRSSVSAVLSRINTCFCENLLLWGLGVCVCRAEVGDGGGIPSDQVAIDACLDERG